SGAVRKASPPQNCPSFSDRDSTASRARAAAGKLGKVSAMIGTSPECERGDHRGQFGPDVVRCDQELRLNGERGRERERQTCKAIARSPGASRGFAFLGHGSGLPRDQRVQRLGWNDRPATDANRAKATSRNVIVERRPAKA